MEQKIKKGDIVLIFVVILIFLFSLFISGRQEKGSYVRITEHGRTKQYLLSEDCTIELEDDSKYNQIIIKNDEVYMEKANCKDLICVKHKPISKNGESIICLPNQVYIEVISDVEKEIDN